MERRIPAGLFFFFIMSVLLLWGTFNRGFSQSLPEETYSKVRVMATSPEDLRLLQEYDVTVDHYLGSLKTGIELVINQTELTNLQASGLPYEVLIPDVSEYYRNRRPATEAELAQSRQIQAADNVTGFGYGSMGGFYTYAEVVAELDSMRLLYPNLISTKTEIGLTEQNRIIWMVKISDNPDLNESAEEAAVYYDALHHAREPASMTVMLYYMYWLLENYGIDPQATYLINNREMFFVPVVNPDGYVYNQTTDPNGGGMWRKNRRDSVGPCFGVDLNRNYSFGYGGSGSSGDPCSDTYRGTAAFSEPETQAVRDLVALIQPAIGFSLHSVAGAYLNPYGYTNVSPEYEIYAEFASDFAEVNQYLYGRTDQILSYTSSGTTRDYLHSVGTYAWTPEIGGSDFWPFQSEIIPVCSENLYGLKYLSWVAGAFADFQNYQILGSGYARPGDPLAISVSVKNRGLTRAAQQVAVSVTTNYPHVTPLVTAVNYDTIAARQIKQNVSQPFLFQVSTSASFLDEIPLVVSIAQEGVETARDTIRVTVGKAAPLFFDDGENGRENWSQSGSGQQWDTTFVDFYSEFHCFADSRYGNSSNNTNSYLTLTQNISLAGVEQPRLEFWAKWATETGYDYARLQISTNNGASWTTLAGQHTQIFGGQPSYLGIKHWVKESINLAPYAGQQARFRFYMYTDGGLVGDGFYFDDFKVVDYQDVVVALPGDETGLPKELALGQNYPNPFNPTTAISYQLPAISDVDIRVYNALGQKVRTLAREAQKPAGYYRVHWDGKNDAGQAVGSGVYICRLSAGERVLTRKMLLIR